MGQHHEERTVGWVNGDPVTHRITGEIGGVKWTHARQSDGKRFVRVRVPGREEVWENGHWVLGQGAQQRTCYECGYPFRTDDADATFCLACARHHRPRYERDAVSFAHAHNRLFGTATPYEAGAPEPAPAPPREDDDFETPF
jgi:hypothetical protein